MRKLENIIAELPEEDYGAIEKSLSRNNAEKFLALLRLYRQKTPPDKITDQLGTSSGALYALKSRLYDRIQSFLSGNLFGSSDQVIVKLHEIPDMCYRRPREISIAFLLKLEQELKQLDMHNELVLVYSALKKMNLFSDAYFQYSQLYNKHIAYNLSIEKSEEILGSFNRLLRLYDFSRSQEQLDTLLFLRNEIASHYTLHQSRQVEIISHLIAVQTALFSSQPVSNMAQTHELLARCSELIMQLPEASPLKPWTVCIDYLHFEYFLRSGRLSEAAPYYDRLKEARTYILLMANVCVTSFFPVSEQLYLYLAGQPEYDARQEEEMKRDPSDVHAEIQVSLAKGVAFYHSGQLREAAATLNQVLNNHSTKDAFHLGLEVKLMLIFIYLQAGESDQATFMLKNLSRKVKSDHPEYRNVLHLFNLFGAEARTRGKLKAADAEQFLLFESRNNGKTQVLRPLLPDMRKIYLIT